MVGSLEARWMGARLRKLWIQAPAHLLKQAALILKRQALLGGLWHGVCSDVGHGRIGFNAQNVKADLQHVNQPLRKLSREKSGSD